MFGNRVRLFKLLGFEVKVDFSWLLLALLITWSLATGLFPGRFPGLSTGTYWWMGAVAALGLFASIVFHELSHSLVARVYGLPIKGITLFVFGGVAEMEDEPASPKAELLMAIAGPVSSLLLAFMFALVALLGERLHWPIVVSGVFDYLGLINAIVAIFNLLPAFPLDGGRVLRAILWRWKRNMSWATRIASEVGAGFGTAMMIVGAFQALGGRMIGGIWLFMIGMFLRNAAQMSYRQLLMRRAMEGERIVRFMREDPVTVPASLTLHQLVEDYVYRYHYKMFPVIEGDRLLGCVTVKQVKGVPREQWDKVTVREIAEGCSAENAVGPDIDIVHALALMHRTGSSRLLVVKDGRLAGIISLKDMLKFLSLKLDLEGPGE